MLVIDPIGNLSARNSRIIHLFNVDDPESILSITFHPWGLDVGDPFSILTVSGGNYVGNDPVDPLSVSVEGDPIGLSSTYSG